ncbi:MAG: tetratricopeptide repeat protein [Saprospiraceae bacterium]|nr:tetratricopeptide repeat protein [Saprospiraceae bacterium]
MARFTTPIFFLLLLMACTTEDPAVQNILDMERTSSGDEGKLGDLMAAYVQYANEHPEDSKWSPQFMLRGAKIAVDGNRFQQAIPVLGKLLKNYPDSEGAKSGFLLLADIYGNKLSNPSLAKPIYTKLLSSDPENAAAKAFMAKNPQVEELDVYLESLKNSFVDTVSGNINRTAILDYQRGAWLRGLTLKDDKTVDWLLSGGETARMVKNNQNALDFFDWILQDYSDSPKASQALFLKAFTLDNELNQDEAARPVYEEFLEKYPEDGFADDAKFLLNNLGKTDEEIIQSFQEK